MRISSLFVALVAAAAILVGCGSKSDTASKSSSTTSPSKSSSTTTSVTSSPTAAAIDIAAIESRIENSLTAPGAGGQGPQTTNPSVKCPSNVVGRVSETFTCDVTAAEGPSGPQPGAPMTGTAEVTLKDATGKQFQLHVKLQGDGYSIENSESG
jgi:hypothetical protein